MTDREIEVRFLEIDPKQIIKKVKSLGGEDFGEDTLQEKIFYDKDLNWQYKEKKQARIRTLLRKNLDSSQSSEFRKTDKEVFMAFKHITSDSVTGTIELEFKIEDPETASKFLQAIGLVLYRTQERKRHKLTLNEVIIDIDFYPKVPPLVELEGPSEKKLKEIAKLLDLDWKKVIYESSRFIIEKRYGIPVPKLRVYTFKEIR